MNITAEFVIIDVLGPDGELFRHVDHDKGKVKLFLEVTIDTAYSNHDGTSREYSGQIEKLAILSEDGGNA